jgi:riboflavin synthase
VFTGIVEEVGVVDAVENLAGGRRLWVGAGAVLDDARPGDSIAVNGCCLTVSARDGARFAVEAVPETLSRTTLAECAPGTRVNLERALRADQRLGGHFVQGHVDGVGEVKACAAEGIGKRIEVELPAALLPFVAEKGSLTLDGVSLTVAALHGRRVEVALVPHTLAATVAADYVAGRRVNVEVDLLARYLARLIEAAGTPGAAPGGRSEGS